MLNPGSIIVLCDSAEQVFPELQRVNSELPREVKKIFSNIILDYISHFSDAHIHNLVNGKTVDQIIFDYQASAQDEKVAGELEGVQYKLYNKPVD